MQTQNGLIFAITQIAHQQYGKVIHINPNTIPTGINKNTFEAWKKHTGKKEQKALSKMKKYNIETEIENINRLKDVNPITQHKPTDNLINMYENTLGFEFNDDYKQFIKSVGYSTYNGRDIFDITGDAEDGRDILGHINYAREIGIPNDWLPFNEDNGDNFAYCQTVR